MAGYPSATVVICAYTLDRYDDLLRAIRSAADQSVPPEQVVVVIDHSPALLERLRGQQLAAVTEVMPSTGRPGLSGARNTGVRAARGDVIAFLDDDAWAEPDWLQRQLALYDDTGVLGAGGRIEPEWDCGFRPGHFAPELDWIVGCSYRGLPSVAAQVRNPIGASMSFRRSVFERVGLFDERIGRTAALGGCEETDLCVRVATGMPGGRMVYEPASVVHHRVPTSRTQLGYMISRGWGEGRSKALMSHGTGTRTLAAERRYSTRVLPRAVARGLGAGSSAGVAQAGSILLVLAATAGSYLVHVATREHGPNSRPVSPAGADAGWLADSAPGGIS